MKASFLTRLLAYIIDIIIVTVLVSVICSTLPDNNSLSKLELNSLETQFVNGKITTNEYIDTYKDIIYKNNKNSAVETTINIILLFGYFVVFQYTNKGQTIGKKLFKIKIVDNNTNKSPTVLIGLLRTIIISNMISSFGSIILINYLSKEAYLLTYLTLTEMESLLVVLCGLFIVLRKDGRGLHDLICNTKVIEER